MKLINAGLLSSPFGLKGEIKVVTNINHLDKVFKVNNKAWINNKEYVIKTYRFHKNNAYISFEGYEDINLIDPLLKNSVLVDREMIKLEESEYLYTDLENALVKWDEENLGYVNEILTSGPYPIIRTNELLIPLNEHFLEKVDINNKIVYVKFIGELYDEN